MRNLTFSGTLEIFAEGNGSNKPEVAFVIDYDFTPGHPGSWYRRNGDPGDPPEPAEVTVNSVKLVRDGETLECPEWLTQHILECVDDETLMEHAAEDA